MRNAEEHAKLLAQIAELEKNSVNYFDVEKEFFLIDSNNLAEVKTRLYGYSIQATGIYEEDNLTEEAVAGLDGRGCYVYVENRDGHITIKQDLNGCWGIYLFRHGDYFALSNSLFRLVDHIKYRYPLTVNRDYCNYILMSDFVSHTYSETAFGEIDLVERNVILHIYVESKNLEIEFINYREHTVSVDSESGIATLDRWIDFWSSVICGVAQNTNFIQCDLSGGFDSRVAFTTLLHSGVDLRCVQICSTKSKFHTYPEDYAIASQIARYYDFRLNLQLPVSQFLNYSLSDDWNINLYGIQTIHKSIPFHREYKSIDKHYKITGYGGEVIRHYWQNSSKRFIELESKKAYPYSRQSSHELLSSMKVLLQTAFSAICQKHKIVDVDSVNVSQYLYQETRCRHHFGKMSLNDYFGNRIMLSPLLDPEIRTLQLSTPACSDDNLLMTLILSRYEPDLITFPFDSKRFISPETIEYARKINERFPMHNKKFKDLNTRGGGFYLQPRDTKAEKILLSGKNNPNILADVLVACLKAVFESSRTYGLFTSHFNAELYNYARFFFDNYRYLRSRHVNAVVGIAKALEDVEISQRNRPLYQDMKHFLEQDFAIIRDNNAEIVCEFKKFFTARIDCKLIPTAGTADFKILSVSSPEVEIRRATWFSKNELGFFIQSHAGKLDLVFKVITDGKFYLELKGIWVPNPEDRTKLIPYWIDYTKLIVNGKVIFDALTPVWHDKPYRYNVDVKANEEIKIQVEWLPHRSDT